MFDAVLFNFATKGATEYDFRGERLSVAANQVIGYRHADSVDVLDGSEHSTVVISDALLSRRLSILLDRPVVQPIEFSKSPLDHGSLEGLPALVQMLNGSPLQGIARSLNKQSPSMGNLIVDSFLLSYPNNYTQKLEAPVPVIAPRQVRRAIDYIHAHPAARSSPELLAGLSGASVRSLQYSFLNCVGQTISEYQLALRLQKARDEIDRNKDRSVKEISQTWGFATQSSFTQSFKKAFGVSPSQHRKGEF